MINLFEYQNKTEFTSEYEGMEEFLDVIWANREKNSFYSDEDDTKIESQRFLQFIHKTKEIKSNKYVGVIHYRGQKINLLPKIFYDPNKDYGINETNQIHNHILWWLSYCRKIKFPNYRTSLGSVKNNFFEILIYVFSKYTRELLNSSIYRHYEELDRELPFIKGRLNIQEYINQNLSTGRWHKLNCTYDAFITDNMFNRIIKYVATMLFNITGSTENKKYLGEILFILEDVSLIKATPEQCANIKFNLVFSEFEIVRDYCYLFLSNCISYDYKIDLKLFAFLIPMEYIFEDFIFGFIEKELDDVIAKPHRRDVYLAEGKVFLLNPDLFITAIENSFIADTKYKIAYTENNDPKNGIEQNDLYQMLAYAVRFNVEKVILFYPNTVSNYISEPLYFTLKDELAGGKAISATVRQLPIINKDLLYKELDKDDNLIDLFETTKVELKNVIEATFKSISFQDIN